MIPRRMQAAGGDGFSACPGELSPGAAFRARLGWDAPSPVRLEDYKTVLYRQEDGSWVAEIPAISGCYALMPTREAALAELAKVFSMLAEEHAEKGLPLPADTTEIVHA
jgi:predicted RNase H-like HicB family nuclease